jgi:hypothetical protein
VTSLLPAGRFVVLTDKHGRFRSIAIVSGAEPEVVPGEHGFLWVDTGVGGALENPVLKMWDEDSRVWRALTPGSSSGPAGGDLAGNYPGPTVAGIRGRAVSSAAPADGCALAWDAAVSEIVWMPMGITLSELSKTEVTHNGVTVNAAGVKRGAGGSPTHGVDARGYNRCSIFVSISGLSPAAALRLRMYRRMAQAGEEYTPIEVLADALADGNSYIPAFILDAPYFMIEAATTAGTATLSVQLYLFRE